MDLHTVVKLNHPSFTPPLLSLSHTLYSNTTSYEHFTRSSKLVLEIWLLGYGRLSDSKLISKFFDKSFLTRPSLFSSLSLSRSSLYLNLQEGRKQRSRRNKLLVFVSPNRCMFACTLLWKLRRNNYYTRFIDFYLSNQASKTLFFFSLSSFC